MSNPEHLEKFRESIQIPNPLKLSDRILSKTISETWDKWREENQDIEIDLSNERFYGADLTEADLRKVNLKQVNLSNSDCSHADISFANCNNTTFSGAILFKTNFTSANLSGAYLNDTKCNRANFYLTNLTRANLEGTTLDFADLSFSSLICTNFNGSKINKAKFIGADLRGANLQMCQALEADFTEADFTGACIQDWKINSDTKFDRVKCDFIYLQTNEQERIPHNPKVNFKKGEFEKFITKAQNTVDLIFTNGIDWQAFLQAFLKLKSETGDELSIYSIEDKWDGYFVVRVNVPPDADKKEIETLLKVKDAEIEGFRRENLTLQRIIESKPQIIQQIFFGDANGIAAIVEGDQNIYPPQTDIIEDGYNKKE
ncbi:pentapeptide repeat-containing protein [Phormidium tenue]|jgi:uncharacterized protein YjbI with pentapeptide repeats|uniref:Pentapeptide repeat-containing protein n=1 Tax=Phormidium tenue FACHB-1050 TaxID=2692857 RepID=A0ABR8CEM8_9CYAN|nr:pentapeptide repeat-containing protein [Phormidium tenue]MBD2318570.1 pentapeptide repeat-containing protein [Phormidium tenue FACHB-1050]